MIYTGYFGNIKKYTQNGLIPISVAGKWPDWFVGFNYQALIPKYSWWKEWHDNHLSNEWYTEKYFETVLNKLDVHKVADDLSKISNPILLCYEKPPQFCHRHLISAWLNDSGFDCQEYE